jgi:hypothetical protein
MNQNLLEFEGYAGGVRRQALRGCWQARKAAYYADAMSGI